MIAFASSTIASGPITRRQPVETFIRREDAERFFAEVRGHDPELASHLRIADRELEAEGRN